MNAETFPEEVRRLVATHIQSVEQLEVLLLLCRERDRDWTAEQVAAELRIDSGSAGARLEDLRARGFVECASERYRFQTKSPELSRSVEALAEAYRERRVSLINLIFSKPVDKVRLFADAFKLWKDESDG